MAQGHPKIVFSVGKDPGEKTDFRLHCNSTYWLLRRRDISKLSPMLDNADFRRRCNPSYWFLWPSCERTVTPQRTFCSAPALHLCCTWSQCLNTCIILLPAAINIRVLGNISTKTSECKLTNIFVEFSYLTSRCQSNVSPTSVQRWTDVGLTLDWHLPT